MTCRLLSLSSEAMWPELLRLLENRDNPDQTVETDVRAMLDAVHSFDLLAEDRAVVAGEEP